MSRFRRQCLFVMRKVALVLGAVGIILVLGAAGGIEAEAGTGLKEGITQMLQGYLIIGISLCAYKASKKFAVFKKQRKSTSAANRCAHGFRHNGTLKYN